MEGMDIGDDDNNKLSRRQKKRTEWSMLTKDVPGLDVLLIA
jgi:hypothetical protein